MTRASSAARTEPPAGSVLPARPAPAVLVPLKPFHRAKSRLGSGFDDVTRALIAEGLARRVLEVACRAFPEGRLYVVAEPSLAAFATANGASLLRQAAGASTLGAIVDAALVSVAAEHARALVLMGDLPDIAVDTLRALAAHDADVVLAESENGDGTNALVLALPARFATAFAEPTSGHVHEARARGAGSSFLRVRDSTLVRDLDRPHDVREHEVAELQASVRRSRATSRSA